LWLADFFQALFAFFPLLSLSPSRVPVIENIPAAPSLTAGSGTSLRKAWPAGMPEEAEVQRVERDVA